MRTFNLIIVFCLLIFLFPTFSSVAGDGYIDEKESNWSKKLKERKLNRFRNRLDSSKTSYPKPVLTIHLGASYTTNTGNIQLNSENIPGTMINLRNDLGFPKYSIQPRVNAILNFGNLNAFAFDMYNILRTEHHVLTRDIKYRDTTFLAGSPVKSRLSLNYLSFSYINFFYNNGRARVAYLAGVTGIFYNLKITNRAATDYSQQKSILVPLPTIGLNGSIYACKNLFLRATVKYSAWWSKNYNCNVLDINPYFEYYIYKNFGLGMRYNFGYTSLKNLPDKKFNGSIKNNFNAISVVLVFRFLKKDSKS